MADFTLRKSYPCYLANERVMPNTDLTVTDKYRQIEATRVPLADGNMVETAIEEAQSAAPEMASLAPFERQRVLQHCVDKFKQRFDELAATLCVEAGKPIRDSRGEVQRLIETFEIAARESVQSHGQMMNLEISDRSRGYQGFYERVPIGPCSFISPFNFPLNLAAHKIAPAIAAGCPFVLKPASLTPVGAILIGEVLAETDLPKGAFSILPIRRENADLFTTDDRLKLLSFTGSPDVGWALKEKAGKKKVVLELGGNAACLIDEGADLDDAVDRVIHGAFYQSGQSCISVQRILTHESIADEFESKLVAAAKALRSGDPRDEDVFIGPMIAEKEAERLESWIAEAVDQGAQVLCGGTRDGLIVDATLLKYVPQDQSLQCAEAFGPVAVLDTFQDFDEALRRINRSRFGIHAGVFTPSLDHAFRAWRVLEVGGVMINEVPSWRVDHMPYGGVKDSGLGREGVRYAMEEMTEIRTLVFRNLPRA